MLTFFNSLPSLLSKLSSFASRNALQHSPSILILQSRTFFGNKKSKKVKELEPTIISFDSISSEVINKEDELDYSSISLEVKKTQWESLPFDQLCALDGKLLKYIELDIKKDKFNISDAEFYQSSPLALRQIELSQAYGKLNQYYKKIYSLLISNHAEYDSLRIRDEKWDQTEYLHEMMILDLEKNQELKDTIRIFIDNVSQTRQLEGIAEPTLIKYLLGLKRQLMLQGIRFTSQKSVKREKINVLNDEESNDVEEEFQESSFKEMQQTLSDNQKQVNEKSQEENLIHEQTPNKHKTQVKITKILNYEYEFWVDVLHNRAKNGVMEEYIVEQRQIQNPNHTLLLKQRYPTIRVKYIVHKEKRRQHEMHYCIKCEMIVKVDDLFERKIKVEWKGPSNKDSKGKEQKTARMGFIVIDYEQLLKGNPTIKPIFVF